MTLPEPEHLEARWPDADDSSGDAHLRGGTGACPASHLELLRGAVLVSALHPSFPKGEKQGVRFL